MRFQLLNTIDNLINIERFLIMNNNNISTINDRVFYASISNSNNISKFNDSIRFTISNEIISIKKDKIVFYNFKNVINNKSINDASMIKNDETINDNKTINDKYLFKFNDIVF